jgi:arsenite methyltransferase
MTIAPALQKALDLLVDPPADPDVRNGYLDLLGAAGEQAGVPKNTGVVQKMWASAVGSMLYDNAQATLRRLATTWREPLDWLNIPAGGTALDVGSGPGDVTASLAYAVGSDGLVLGVDISEPMLTRAVRAHSVPQVGFLRADAQRLPLRDATVDAVSSMLVLQLVPEPALALAEMVRVLRPGGRLVVLLPTVGRGARLLTMLPMAGAHLFGEDEVADILERHGLVGVRTRTVGTMQWVRARRP